MTRRNPDFDLDQKIGAQSELWVSDVCKMMAGGTGTIEVKAPKPFLKFGSPYVEYACKWRDGIWHASGIATTKANLWVFTFGSLPGAWVIETEWLRRAARLSYKNKRNRREEKDGNNPTKGVIVTMAHLNATKDREP